MGRWYNPIMSWLLRSPLHGMVSNGIMLITVTGRKSGKQYTTPINYAREGNTIRLITSRKHGWWKNVQSAAPVVARVKGSDFRGTARVVDADSQAMLAAIQTVYRGIPPAKASELVPDMVLIQIDLN